MFGLDASDLIPGKEVVEAVLVGLEGEIDLVDIVPGIEIDDVPIL